MNLAEVRDRAEALLRLGHPVKVMYAGESSAYGNEPTWTLIVDGIVFARVGNRSGTQGFGVFDRIGLPDTKLPGDIQEAVGRAFWNSRLPVSTWEGCWELKL